MLSEVFTVTLTLKPPRILAVPETTLFEVSRRVAFTVSAVVPEPTVVLKAAPTPFGLDRVKPEGVRVTVVVTGGIVPD